MAPIEISTKDASEITFNSATLHGSINKIDNEIISLGFFMETMINGVRSTESFDITPSSNTGNISFTVKGLIPNQKYSYHIFAETENSDFYGESIDFTTSEFSANKFSVSPDIGTAETLIEITGPFDGFLIEPSIRFYFPQENEEWKDIYAQGAIESSSEDRVVVSAPQVFVSDINFSTFKANVSIAFNDKPYEIGEFQFTRSFYIDEKTLTVSPGKTIEVITDNGLTDNIFKVNNQVLSGSAWLIDNGVHRNTVTIPDDFSSGTYQIIVVSKSGNPLSLKPGNSDTFTIQ